MPTTPYPKGTVAKITVREIGEAGTRLLLGLAGTAALEASAEEILAAARAGALGTRIEFAAEIHITKEGRRLAPMTPTCTYERSTLLGLSTETHAVMLEDFLLLIGAH